MNLEVVDLTKRKEGDPEYADFWLSLRHTNYHSVEHAYISWEVPLTKSELDSLWDSLPKSIRAKRRELGLSV